MHEKREKSLCRNTATPNNDGKSVKPNKDVSRWNFDSRKISSKKGVKDEKCGKCRDVIVILGDSKIKDVKGWELTDALNKVVVKSFCGATTSQMKWYVKPTKEQNLKNIILHCATNDINDDLQLQNIAEEIAKLGNSITEDCNSDVTISGIVPRYGKSNENVRSVNHLLPKIEVNMALV